MVNMYLITVRIAGYVIIVKNEDQKGMKYF